MRRRLPHPPLPPPLPRVPWRPALLALCLLAACHGEPAPVAVPAGPAPVDTAAVVLPDVMEWVVEPAAAVLAAAADQHGWASLGPRSEEAWQAVVDAAAELVRTSDMLAGPALAQGRADWLQAAAAMREGAALAAAAARRHDQRGLYLAGTQVKSGCQGCHARQGVAPAGAAAPDQR